MALLLGSYALGLSPWIARVIQSFKFGGVEVSLREQIEEQKHDIEALKFLFTNFLGPYEIYSHLESLANHVPFEVDVDLHYPENLRGELTRFAQDRVDSSV